MPKRKKHPRLPNAFGSIRYIGKGRTNPYAVHPPVTETNEAGVQKHCVMLMTGTWDSPC